MVQKNYSSLLKTVLVLLITALVFSFFALDLDQYLTLDSLKQQRANLKNYYQAHPWVLISGYVLIYILVTALSLPGAVIMTLAGGAILGPLIGTITVSFASTIGATLAFLTARFLLRDYIQKKFHSRLKVINDGIQRDGAFFLFTMRLIPAFPFFLINLTMGLTSISILTFFFVSQIGMLPGTFVFVNAGYELAQIDSLVGILSPRLIASFALIGLLPLILKLLIIYLKSRKLLKKYKVPKKFDYNIIAIGGGSAGLVTSYIAAAVKAKVALIEKNKMGGDCLNTGCVPSKALIRSAKAVYQSQNNQQYGIESTEIQFNFKDIMQRVHSTIQKIEPHDSIERYSQLGVDCFQEKAQILSPYEVKVGEQTLTTKNIVIATGASPIVPQLPGLKESHYLTSENIWQLQELPQKLVVVGGGPIGCELAQSFRRLGSQVTIIERGTTLLSREDDEVSQWVESQFTKEGIEILKQISIEGVHEKENSPYLSYKDSHQKQSSLNFDKILFAIGRRANVKGFGLEDLNIELTDRGTIAADDFLRTNYPNIYVCGDVAGPYQFTHTAAHQAWYASVNALFSPLKKFKVDYSVIPMATFTDPEVARVGLNEKEAQEQEIPYEVSTYSLDDLDRAIADGNDRGMIKVLTEPGKDRILGAMIVGDHAGDLISEFVLAMKHKIGLNKILGTIHIYPTHAEMNKFVAGNWKKAHAPKKLLEWIEKFHRWRL